MMRRVFFLLAALAFVPPLAAHEVHLEQSTATAAVVRLNYADGQPFAYEAYELYLPGQSAPHQVGRTTAAGEVIFLPAGHPEWRLKAFTGDGHGLDRPLRVSVVPGASTESVASSLPRWTLLLAGAGVIFGIFGFLQLFLRKKKS